MLVAIYNVDIFEFVKITYIILPFYTWDAVHLHRKTPEYNHPKLYINLRIPQFFLAPLILYKNNVYLISLLTHHTTVRQEAKVVWQRLRRMTPTRASRRVEPRDSEAKPGHSVHS